MDSLQVALLNDITKNLIELNRGISDAQTYLTSAGITSGLLHELTNLYREKYSEMVMGTGDVLSKHDKEATEYRENVDLSDLFSGQEGQ